ncbi:MAG: phosphoribosyltransferase [wastewater metagenome]|nr:phosphoribosyltransferase [Candidatus Loosdrechtia aerotolerans]
MKNVIFKDRIEAGRRLAEALVKRGYRGQPLIVLGIPRGGIVVAEKIADDFSAPLDVVIVRKIRAPNQPELGIGAVVDGDNISILNEEMVHALGVSQEYLEREIAYQKEEIERRLRLYRGDRPAPDIAGKNVVVVDDGIATGYTFRAALEGLHRRNPAKLIAAVPVAARSSIDMVDTFADDTICLSIPESFVAVGAWYLDFNQVSDEEAIEILHRNWAKDETKRPVGM